jgi:hypothetical protein
MSGMNDKANAETKVNERSAMSESRWRLSDRQIGIIGLWTGIILGVLGILSGYYFYAISLQERIPTALIDPTRTVIVDSDVPGSSDLTILYREKPVGRKSVSAVRIYFWNAGKLPIVSKDVYNIVKFVFPSDIEILDVKIIKTSRDIVKPTIAVDHQTPSAVDLSFDVLERDDGVGIQIIYAGLANAPITLRGLIADTPGGIRTLTAYSSPEQNLWRTYLQGAARTFDEHRMLIYLAGTLFMLLVILAYVLPRRNIVRTVASWLLPFAVVALFAAMLWWPLFTAQSYQPLYDVPKSILGNE